MFSPDTLTYSINGGGQCHVLTINSSVFPLFSFSLLHTIRESISETHASILAIEPGCSAWVGLNERDRDSSSELAICVHS